MAADDLYFQWLKIPPGARPPDHYALLGISRSGATLEQIEAAAQARMAILDRYALHPDTTRRDACQRMMNEVAQARIALVGQLKRAALPAKPMPAKAIVLAAASNKETVVAPKKEAVVAVAPAKTSPPKSAAAAPVESAQTAAPSWFGSLRAMVACSAGAMLLALLGLLAVVVHFRNAAHQSVAVLTTDTGKIAAEHRAGATPSTPSAPVNPPVAKPAATPAVVPPVRPIENKPAIPAVNGNSPHPAEIVRVDPEKHAPPVAPTPIAPPKPALPAPLPTPAPSPTPAPAPTPTVKNAVPNAAQQEVATKLFDAAFGQDLKNAKSAIEKSTLAKRMLSVAAETASDPAAQYVLYSEAGTEAATAGDVDTAMTAVDVAARQFAIDALKIKSRALAQAVKAPESWQNTILVIQVCDAMVQDAIDADRYDIALETAAVPQSIPSVRRDPAAAKRLRERTRDLEFLAQEYQASVAARQTLAHDKSDPGANAVVGRFRCFAKQDWTGGLPMLAAGSAGPAQQLAKQELAAGDDSGKLDDVADGWWDLADTQPEAMRPKIKHHAADIYERVLPHLAGLSRRLCEKRVSDFEKSNFPIVNLLALFDVKRDAPPNRCKLDKDAVVYEPVDVDQKVLRLRYCPPREYNLEIEFTTANPDVCLMQYVPVNGHLLDWVLGMRFITGYKSLNTFDGVDVKIPNATTVKGSGLAEKQLHVSVIKVRADPVVAYFDNERVSEASATQFNPKLVCVAGDMQTIDDGLALLATGGPVMFSKIRLIEISGAGHPIPHRNADGSLPK